MRHLSVAGLQLSAVGLGTWQFGAGEWAYGSVYASETAPAIVRRSLDLGVSFFDTAEAYAFGRSERILGEALAERRPEAFVATKLFPVLPVDPVVGHRARRSAARLGIERIDLYQVHWPNPLVSSAHTMPALRRLQQEGLVSHVGVSNYSLDQWQEAGQALGGPVLSNQVRYSLIDRRPEDHLLPWAQANDRLIIAYSPLGQGLLSGRYGPDRLPRGMRASTGPFLPENLRRAEPVLNILREVADAHGASCAQVALAWLLRRDNVLVIPGASSPSQAQANAESADLVLTDDEDRALTGASDRYRPERGLSTVPAWLAARAERATRRVSTAWEGLNR